MVFTVNKENSLLLSMRLRGIVIQLLLACSLHAQLFFNSLSVKDGLAQSSVNFVIADKYGYYWIGTQYGLSRYNGDEFENFYTSTHSGVSDNFFISAITDREGNLWFATRNGICRYLLEKKKFQTLNIPVPNTSLKGYNPIWSLEKTPSNDIYFIAAANCYSVSAKECSNEQPAIKPVFSSAQSVRYLSCSKTQLLLLKNDSVVLYNWQGAKLSKRYSFHYNLGRPGQTLVLRKLNDSFYIASQSQIFRVETNGLKKQNTTFISGDISDLQQYKGSILISTYEGLFQTGPTFDLQRHFIHANESSFSLSENKLLSVSITPDNCVWVGTANSGLNVHKPAAEQFSVISKFDGQRYLSFCVLQISATQLLAGTENGYDIFEKRNRTWHFRSTRFANHKVSAILKHNNSTYIGTNQGLYCESNNSFTRIDAIPAEAQVFDLQLNIKSNELIVSSTEGILVLDLTTMKALHHINRKTKNNKNKSLIGTNYVFSTYLKNPSTLIVNTTTGAYEIDTSFTYSKNLLDPYPYKSLNEIMVVKSISVNNQTFCGSLGNGLYRISNASISVISTQQGLSNNVLASIEKDKDDNLWLSTNQGINCYTKDGRVLPFTNDLPLSSSEFISNASTSFDSTIWFCANSAIIGFQPKQLLASTNTGVFQLTTELISKNYIDTIRNKGDLEFSTTDKNISFRFCVPGINTFNRVNIVYRLRGFDSTWHAAGNNKSISFSTIPAGNYELDVIANLNGSELKVAKNYSLLVIPPLYQRTWFVISTLIFATIITIFLVYYFSRLRLKRKLILLQAEQKVLEEKQRISEELHDNIGSQISSIITGLDKMQLKNNLTQVEHLSDLARGTLHELRETIWALHLTSVSVTEIRSKIENHVFELRNTFEEININTAYSISHNIEFESEKALSVFRIFQEALSNALKHSAATKLEIQLTSTLQNFSLVISDNGIGFDPSKRKSGHYGLDNMIARATKHNIALKITSEPNKGSQISIFLNQHD